MLREDLAAKRHAADGGGQAWIEPDPRARGVAVAGGSGRWTLVYEAGPLGIAEGGTLFLQVSPFWGWSMPQVDSPEAPGFTEVSTQAEGLELSPTTPGQQLLAIGITGRGMKEGERIRIVYGAGRLRARTDSYAERESPFWIAVDGNGDGVRGLLRILPHRRGRTRPAEPARPHPAQHRPSGRGGPADAGGAGSVRQRGTRLRGCDRADGSEGPEDAFRGAPRPAPRGPVQREGSRLRRGRLPDRGRGTGRSAAARATRWSSPRRPPGPLGRSPRSLEPLGRHRDPRRLTYAYARDVAALDVAALTDHDHWGMLPLLPKPRAVGQIREQAEASTTRTAS